MYQYFCRYTLKKKLVPQFRDAIIGTICALAFVAAIIPIGYSPSFADGVHSEPPQSRIVVFKERQILEFHRNGSLLKAYRVCLGTSPRGPKRMIGDSKTPEGDYFVCYKSVASRFHRFLGISYPGAQDAQDAFEHGLISLDDRDSIIASIRNEKIPPWETKMGGWVGIHGYPSEEYQNKWALLLFPKPHNWTDGCIAMWNFEIEELFPKVSLGTPISILP